MNNRKIGLGLGIFSIGLGLAELMASRRITRALDADGHEKLVKAFGAREMLAGASLLAAPTAPINAWARAAGDMLDIAATGAAVRNSPRNGMAWGALAFVVGALVVDTLAARAFAEGDD